MAEPTSDERDVDRLGPLPSLAAVAGVVLTVLGVVLWILSGLVSRHEVRSDTDAGAPPYYVTVTVGHQYWLSIPGGPGAEPLDSQGKPLALECTSTGRGSTPLVLTVTPDTTDKSIDQIGSFVATYSGDIHVACSGIPQIYIDDADGTFDVRGTLVLVASILLTIGLPLLVSAAAAARRRRQGELVDA